MSKIFEELVALAKMKGLELHNISKHPFYKDRKRETFGIFKNEKIICSYATLEQIRKFLAKDNPEQNYSVTYSLSREVILKLENLAIKHGCQRGTKPNTSELLRKIAAEELKIVEPD